MSLFHKLLPHLIAFAAWGGAGWLMNLLMPSLSWMQVAGVTVLVLLADRVSTRAIEGRLWLPGAGG